MKTWVYVDGFNLYYGALKDTPNKWLDLSRMSALLLPGYQITKIKYFAARERSRRRSGQTHVPTNLFSRLENPSDLNIVLGRFLAHDVMMPLAQPAVGGSKFAKVVKTEEKGSDVNIAAHLINDGYKKEYEAAVLVTNDSDLLEPIRIVRLELGLPVGLLNPQKHTTSKVLAQQASFVKQIRQGVLAASQFPDMLTDVHGAFHKPASW